MAVFTLPADLIGLYKQNIDYITDHAVDPDKRRYAVQHEAVRHYIDIDQWGVYPFENVPRQWHRALAAHTKIFCVSSSGDSAVLYHAAQASDPVQFAEFFREHILPQYYEDGWVLDCDTVQSYLDINCAACASIAASEDFSEHGILPYHLLTMQRRLTQAFRSGDAARVLRISADFGHYIADAHVPLHTTINYNGQLTQQVGIHAFWETRIPELFAERDYDFFVGPARYIEDPQTYFWNIVLKSHALVKEVLRIEKELSQTYPSDEQYCFDERLSVTVRTQCPEYARAYSDAMRDMVEGRMRAAILAIGSAWYTAWVDAGQPEFGNFAQTLTAAQKDEFERLEQEYRLGEIKGRAHPE